MTLEEMQEKMFGEFKVECKMCGSSKVIIDSNLGFSPQSGSWGSVDFWCIDCENYHEIFKMD